MMTVNARNSGARSCPFFAALAAYVGTILLAAGLLSTVPSLTGVRVPIIGPLVAAGVAGILLEIRRRQSDSCPWLDVRMPMRLAMYLLLFVVGVLVVFPGVWPSLEVHWVFRIPFLLLAIAGLALLRLHSTVDHSPLDETGVSRGTYFAARLPVYFLIALIAAAVIACFATVIAELVHDGSDLRPVAGVSSPAGPPGAEGTRRCVEELVERREISS